MAEMTINGDVVVYNNAVVSINGEDTEINGYIQGIDYDTGTSSEHVQALSVDGSPLEVNPINDSPSGTIRFAPGAFKSFYSLMNNRFQSFTLTIEEFVTGNLAGSSHTITIQGAKKDGGSGNIGPQQAASTKSFRFKATKIIE